MYFQVKSEVLPSLKCQPETITDYVTATVPLYGTPNKPATKYLTQTLFDTKYITQTVYQPEYKTKFQTLYVTEAYPVTETVHHTGYQTQTLVSF